jgi:hypothetical protein
MRRHQDDIDELARMERICQDLALDSTLPEERAAFETLASNYRAEVIDIRSGNASARCRLC